MGLVVPLFWDSGEAAASAVFFEVRRLSNSEKSSLIVPFKLLKRSKAPEAGTGLLAAAEAAAQASAVFPAPEAGCGSANQGSELLETGCVLAPVGTPQGSTEAAGLAPEGRQDKFRDALTKF